MTDETTPSAANISPDAILVLLTRIERHLDRIARAAENLTNAPISFQKELGAVRTMPEPLPR